jgi:hypothetical protein
MKTYAERERRAYAAGQPDLADLFAELARLQARADGLGDLLGDLISTIEWASPPAADRWIRANTAALNEWLE